MTVQVGDQVGDYRLVREVGRGTFGVVYAAQQVYLGTQVAIKLLLNTAPEEREHLLAEARKIAAWRHPQITQVLGFSEHQGQPYLVLQYVPNGTLARHYLAGRQHPLATFLPHVQQIAEGVQYAHDRQTLHLDLKPANVLLDEQQTALISDFGISVILQPAQSHQSLAHVAGTPAYMAPEQLQQKPGYASDQYALATMVYQWLTGSLPFSGDVWSLGVAKLTQEPHPLRQHAPTLSPAVEAVVLKGLATDPKARYPSMWAFAQALEQAGRAPALGTLLLTLTGHTGSVYAVAWSPDGQRLASASEDGTVRLWGAERGQPLASLTGHTGEVNAVAWSLDGRRLASASSDGTVRLWDAVAGQPLATLTGHVGAVRGVAWSPDGLLASAGEDEMVRLWDGATGQPLATLTGDTDWVWAVAWSPNLPPTGGGRRLVSAGIDGTVRLWDGMTGQPLATLTGHTGGVRAVGWSPDGRRLASASYDWTVRLWDGATGQPLATLTGHTNGVRAIAWSPDKQRLASAGEDGTVRLWDGATGQPQATLTGLMVWAVAWSPGARRLASAGEDGTVRVWWVG